MPIFWAKTHFFHFSAKTSQVGTQTDLLNLLILDKQSTGVLEKVGPHYGQQWVGWATPIFGPSCEKSIFLLQGIHRACGYSK